MHFGNKISAATESWVIISLTPPLSIMICHRYTEGKIIKKVIHID